MSRSLTHGHSDMMADFRVVLDIIGAVGFVLIIVLAIGAIPMIPDLIRYLRLKNM